MVSATRFWSKFHLSIFIILLALILSTARMGVAGATATEGAPSQVDCNSGSTTYTWTGEGIDIPVIASLSVDGEEVDDPANPENGSIGAAICPSVEQGRRTGLFVYYRNGSTNDFDLSNAVTPDTSSPITADSDITITLTDMGTGFANRYSFALIHGNVSNWETSNLGTDSASVNVTMSPVRTPYGNGDDFAFCTATPPNCNANASDVDALSASMDMTFNEPQEGSNDFEGAYFALTGAMGGFVQAERNDKGEASLVATLGAPHFLANGTTLNTGSMQAFLPTSVLEDLLELPPGDVDESSLEVTRTESGDSEEAPFSIVTTSGGVIVRLSNITFSSPAYTIGKATPGSATDSTPGLPETGGQPEGQKAIQSVLTVVLGTALLTSLYLLHRRRISQGR